MDNGLHRWMCSCGHELYTSQQPTPVKQGHHTCNFMPMPHIDNQPKWVEIEYNDIWGKAKPIAKMKDFIDANYVCADILTEMDLIAVLGLGKGGQTVVWDKTGNGITIRRIK